MYICAYSKIKIYLSLIEEKPMNLAFGLPTLRRTLRCTVRLDSSCLLLFEKGYQYRSKIEDMNYDEFLLKINII
jgi:hypothetical protein